MNYFDKTKDNGVLSTYNRDEKIFNLKFWLHDIDYYILDTNYKDFLIGYYCTTNWIGTKLDETFYILTRDINFDLNSNQDISSRIVNALSQFKPNKFKLQNAQHQKAICGSNPKIKFTRKLIKKKSQSNN